MGQIGLKTGKWEVGRNEMEMMEMEMRTDRNEQTLVQG